MTQFSKVVITFSGPGINGSEFNIGYDAGFLYSFPVNIQETYTVIRSAANQVSGGGTIGVPNTTTAVQAAKYLYDAFVADLSYIGLFDFTLSSNIVTIYAKSVNVTFTNLSTATNASIYIETHLGQAPIIDITSSAFSSYTADPGNKINITVTTNRLATFVKLSEVGGYIGNTANPVIEVMPRGIQTPVWFKDSDGNEKKLLVNAPGILNNATVSVQLDATPSGTRATVNLVDKTGMTLQYSLDGTTWQDSNIFPSLTVGAYTVHVKDQYGAYVSIDFNVAVFVPPTAVKHYFSYLSKSMSIRYKRNQNWNNIDIYKTDDNTLSCEENVSISTHYTQMFKPENVITTQFLSNYQNQQANVLRADGSKYALNIIQKMQFLDKKVSMDGWVYRIAEGKAGLYFTAGNYYTYLTTTVIGTYVMNGSLPEFGAIGNYIYINSTWFLIVDIIYNDTLDSDVLVLDYDHTGPLTMFTVSANYNSKNFNVYEFDIDMALFNGEDIQIEILQSASIDNIPDFNYLSENIHVSSDWIDMIELIWYNNTDTMVFYSTGITNLGNYNFLEFKNAIDSTLTVNKTPSTTIVIEASNYETKQLIMDGLTTAIAQQVIEASLHKMIFVNKVGFVSSAVPAITTIDNTNLSEITLQLARTGEVYNAEWAGGLNSTTPGGTSVSTGGTSSDTTTDTGGTGTGTSSSNKGIIIPWYLYPNNPATDTNVQQLVTLMHANPTVQVIVVINPNSGPVSTYDSNYSAFIDLVHANNGKVVGYVSTAYGNVTTRPISSVHSDIDLWQTVYPSKLDGIFLDEQPWDASFISQYVGYRDYCRAAGFNLIVGNPGATQQEAWFSADAADIIIIHENSSYPIESNISPYLSFPRPPECAVLVYNQPTFSSAQLTMVMKYVKWVYVTNDTLPNPWDTLSNQLASTFTTLAAL